MSDSAFAASPAQLVGCPRLAGIVAGHRQAAAQLAVRFLESADVVPLPAMERDGDGAKPRQRRIGVDTEVGIALSGELVGGVSRLTCHK